MCLAARARAQAKQRVGKRLLGRKLQHPLRSSARLVSQEVWNGVHIDVCEAAARDCGAPRVRSTGRRCLRGRPRDRLPSRKHDGSRDGRVSSARARASVILPRSVTRLTRASCLSPAAGTADAPRACRRTPTRRAPRSTQWSSRPPTSRLPRRARWPPAQVPARPGFTRRRRTCRKAASAPSRVNKQPAQEKGRAGGAPLSRWILRVARSVCVRMPGLSWRGSRMRVPKGGVSLNYSLRLYCYDITNTTLSLRLSVHRPLVPCLLLLVLQGSPRRRWPSAA